MPFALGVDLGTTNSAAAIGRDGRVDVVSLGGQTPAMPSVVLLRETGEVLVGDAAERRSRQEPTRVAREFKRRLGDPTPLVLGGTPYGTDDLMARLLQHIVDQVTREQGEPPASLVVTHPADYGPYKIDLLGQIARRPDVAATTLVAEPVAAAVKLAGDSRIDEGDLIAVYDLGGGTFDAAVVRKAGAGFEIVGTPAGLARLGGADFDHAVMAHVDAALGGALRQLDAEDAAVQAATGRLLDECRHAKEGLSFDADVAIEVNVPGVLSTQVRLTRAEFEDMIRPRLLETVGVLESVVSSAGATMEQIKTVLLVGGSARIPLVYQLVASRTGRPVVVDPYPKLAVAIGAAIVGLQALTATPPEAVEVEPPPPETGELPMVAPIVEPPPEPPSTVVGPPPPGGEEPRRRRWPVIAAAAVLILLALVAAAFVFLNRPDEVAGDGTTTSAEPTSTSTTSTTTATTTTAPPPPPPTPPTAPPPPPPPPEPTGLTVTGGGGSGEVSVTWDAMPNPPVSRFQVERQCPGGDFEGVLSHPNVDDGIQPPDRRGFIEFAACEALPWCYRVSSVALDDTISDPSETVCGDPS